MKGIWAKRYSLVYRAGPAVFLNIRKSLLRRFCTACLLDITQFPQDRASSYIFPQDYEKSMHAVFVLGKAWFKSCLAQLHVHVPEGVTASLAVDSVTKAAKRFWDTMIISIYFITISMDF